MERINQMKRAIDFIDRVIKKHNHSDNIYKKLESKLGDWELELWKLNDINVFELTGEQIDRKAFLESAVSHSETLLSRHKFKKATTQTVVITGNNISINGIKI